MPPETQVGLIIEYTLDQLRSIRDDMEMRMGPEINATDVGSDLLYADVLAAIAQKESDLQAGKE